MSRCDIYPYMPFEHGCDCFYYDPEFSFAKQFLKFIKEESDLNVMATRAKEKVLSFHTSQKWMQYVLSTACR